MVVLLFWYCSMYDLIVSEFLEDISWDEWDGWDIGDLISVLDLFIGEYFGNIFGFGFVVWFLDGSMVVGWVDWEVFMIQWNIFIFDVFGVIIVDVGDMIWDIVEVGDV